MATDFTSQITAIYQAVEYRTPPAAELAVYNASLQSGSMTLAQVQSAVINDPFTTTIVDAVIREYQAAFNRVPDQAGAAYWVGQIAANPAMLGQLNTIFANSTEFQARFGATATTPANSALVTSLYTNVYGRAPDSAGLQYWSTGFPKDASGNPLPGAQPLHADQLLQAFANAQEFVTQTTPAIQAFQAQEIAGTAPITGSLFAIVPPNVPGSSLVLTTGIDVLNGTAGNDTFVGDNSGANPTVSVSDTLNGGAGVDTFNYFSPTNGVVPQLNSVENVNLISSAGGKALDFTSAVGLQQVTIKTPVAGGDTITLNTGVAAGLDKVVGAINETFVYQTATTAASLNVANGTNDTGTIDLQGANITTLSVNSTGGKNLIGTLTDSTGTVKTLNITGDSALTITNVDASLRTIDASKDTGGVKIGTQLNDAAVFTGGAGNDDITLGANTKAINMGGGDDTVHFNAALGVGGSVDGGAGTNTAAMSAANAALFSQTTTFEKQISNFQKLDIGAVTAATTIDLHNLNDINYVKTSGTAAAGTFETDTVTFTGLNAGQSVTIAGETVTATSANLTATQVETAFLGTAVAGAAVSGTLTGYTAGDNGDGANGIVKLTSTTAGNVPNLTATTGGTAPAGAPTVSTVQGGAATTEHGTITFAPLSAGQSVTVDGLTVTSNGTATLNDIELAFVNGATQGGAVVSGALSGNWALTGNGTPNDGIINFTSNTANSNVADITVSGGGGVAAPAAPGIVTVDGTAGAGLTLNNYTSGGTLELTGPVQGDITAVVKGADVGTSDVFNIKLNGTDGITSTGTVHVANVETINITTAVSGTAAPTQVSTLKLDDAAATTVTISGNHGVDLTGSTLTKLATLDASGETGTGSVGAVTFNGSFQTDATKAFTIKGGAGNDVFTGGNGGDTFTGGAGNDHFVYTNVAQSTLAHTDTITDFQANTSGYGTTAAQIAQGANGGSLNGDVLDFRTIAAANADAKVAVFTVTNSADAQTFLQNTAAGDAAHNTLSAALDSTTGNLYVDVDHNGTADMVIKLAGVSHIDTTAIQIA